MSGYTSPGIFARVTPVKWAPVLVSLSLVLAPTSGVAQKTDTLWLNNGDRLIGEIKRLRKALLQYSTDDLGTVSVEWTKVDRLVSPATLEVEDYLGRRMVGRLLPAPSHTLAVESPGRTDTVSMGLIVEIEPLEASFLQRLSGYVDLGFSFHSANHTLQLTTGTQVKYRGPKVETTFQFSSFFQDQDSVAATSRNTASLSQRVFLKNAWSTGLALSADQNEELNLALRATVIGFLEHAVVQSNVLLVRAGGGLVLTRERYYDIDDVTYGLEAALSGQFEAFRYDRPKLDATVTTTVYPSITEWGRVRIESDARASYELVKDFFLTLSLFDQFDSRPPDVNASKNDFGTTLSISWSW